MAPDKVEINQFSIKDSSPLSYEQKVLLIIHEGIFWVVAPLHFENFMKWRETPEETYSIYLHIFL